MTQGFSKALPGISIEYSGGRSGEQATKLKAERDGGIYSADVFLGGTTTANTQLKPMGAQDPIKPALILPEVTELKYWRDRRIEFSDKAELNLVFVNQIKVQLIFDPKQVKVEEVDELYELLQPKWKGKIVINDPLPSGAGNVSFRWIWEVLGAEKAKDYYRRIRAQAGVVDRDQRRQIEWIAQGKYAILLGPSDGVLQQLLQRGLQFGLLPDFKDYGTAITASFGAVSLVNRAPHPNAARLFINWVLGKEGQTAWSKAMDHVTRRTDVPTDHLPPYQVPRAGGKYWISHTEENVTRSDEEEKILKELFGR
jgi:ABC-type Fe3+ transport system substrate-binding protein